MYRIQELFTEVTKTNRRVVIMGKQLEAMSSYQGCLYQRIMMIMDGVVK